MPLPIPPAIPQPIEQEEIIDDQNIENIDGQDYITEVLNISKVKEGFYIGDKIAAISIEVVVQFKLTHMINASGNQIINQWETIGMKYLTLNWSESPNQILFDPNDEIADKILFFIEDSFINGEGLLAHSFKGQNRVCIVVLIYLMKKYKWSLKKSMEYLKSRKQDVDIPSFFLSQLIKFESRLIQRGELTNDIPWSFEGLKDPEEKLLRNTYINSVNFINKQNKNELNEKCDKSHIRHIFWADSNPYQQIPLSVIDLDKDLFFKKNVKPIFSHQQQITLKPCIKSKRTKQIVNISGLEQKENEDINIKQNNINNNIINNLIKRNLINNNNNNNLAISNNKNNNKKIFNNEEQISENNTNSTNTNISNKDDFMNNNIPNQKMVNNNNLINNNNIPNPKGNKNNNNNLINKNGNVKKKLVNKKDIVNDDIPNENDVIENIGSNIPNKVNFINNNNISNNNNIKGKISNNNNIDDSNSNKFGIMNNNYIINNSNVIAVVNSGQIKKKIKKKKDGDQQVQHQQNQNNFFMNSYNLNNNKTKFNENIQINFRVKNDFNNNADNEQLSPLNKFVPNEIINYKFFDGKDNNINNKINNINNNKRFGNSNQQRNNIKEENIIIIANKCDNIIKNNINNYYINQIGTINNNINNNINNSGNNINNSQNINNFNYENNISNNMSNNKQNSNNYNNMNNDKELNNNYNNISNNMINNRKLSKKHNNNNNNKNNNNSMVNSINNKIIKRQNDFEEIPQEINIKVFNTSVFNNSKILKNNIKNILGTNHKQILGINNNNSNNYYFLGQNYNTANNNNLDSNITPKNSNNTAKVITNLSNKSNGKKFKIIDSSNLSNYNSNSNSNINNSSSNKKHNNNNNSNSKTNNNYNNKENRNRHNHNFNVIVNTRKTSDNAQNSPNQFLGRTSPKNNNVNNYKYDPIISNYNPIKKNRNNRAMNSKNKNYQNNENYENNYNINNVNVNNYNMSSNKPLNNFNPNLIKRKGTPTAGHQTIKINNINNPVKIKNNIIMNFKKPSTPDMIINKSTTMVNNNSYIGSKINNTNNLFNYGIKKNNHFNNNSIHGNKNKKLKNYNLMQRPATAPHKDKPTKEKRSTQIMNNIEENKKGINNYNKNAFKANQRPASAGQGKNNHKDKDKMDNNNIKYSTNNLNGFSIGKKIEIDFGNKYKNSFSKKRVASPQIPTNNKISLGNSNNPKMNPAKYRLPSPMIKSGNLNGKALINNINRSNTSYNMNKSASFNVK